MTINQSRYGGAAEVGRAPTKEPRKDSKRPLVTLAGGTAALGGGVTATQANKRLPNFRSVQDAAQKLEQSATSKYNQRHLPNTVLMRHDLGVGLKGPNQRVSASYYENQLKRLEGETGKANRNVRRVRNVRTAGLAALATGLGVMGASAIQHERSRGTIGYKRPTNRQEALRQAGPTSAAEARYRRTNGM
jgi:hypothetical protein